MPAKIIIVNTKDEQINIKEQGTLDYEKDIYRVSALWITNSEGQILLAKRAYTKKQHPGRWGPAVAGTIEEGETYDSNIIKEAEEELGLKNIKPKKGFKNMVSIEYLYFVQWYFLELNEPPSFFKPDPREIAEIKWFTKDQLRNMKEELTDGVLNSMKELIS